MVFFCRVILLVIPLFYDLLILLSRGASSPRAFCLTLIILFRGGGTMLYLEIQIQKQCPIFTLKFSRVNSHFTFRVMTYGRK